ncbi:MAG: hypothetical protein Q7R87_04310 [Nanoarchaeota archaeon]|nr:hypothetical protein [Nanoarchaeota archaeon]
MNNGDLFFIIFFVFIIVMRILLRKNPVKSPTVKGFRFHHYMYGIILTPIGGLLGNVWIYAIGWALFIDEIWVILTGRFTHEDNYSKEAFLTLGLFVIAFYFLRNWIVFFK